MLIPKDQPYLARLNSYYLYFEKFIEHLQGEIGSGCLYCQAVDCEILVYFDGQEIIHGVIQQTGKNAQLARDFDSVLQALSSKNFLVTVYYLHPASIFYWSEIPPFRRNRTKIDTTTITLPALVTRLQEINFSGFIDITMGTENASAILFYHQGKRLGGSYSWETGGMSSSEEDYNRLLFIVDTADTVDFSIGYFAKKEVIPSNTSPQGSTDALDEEQYFSNLETAIEEFLTIYLTVIKRKIKTDPIVQLKQKFLDHITEYPSLDLFKHLFQLSDTGAINFANDANRKAITEGIIACTWKVIDENKMERKFKTAISKWDYRVALEERGMTVLPE